MRKIALLVVAVVAFTACGGESELDLVAQVQGAASSTLSVDTAKVSFVTVTMGQEMAFDGDFDFANRRARLTADGASFGMPGELDIRYDFGDALVMYVSLPAEARAVLGGSWIELDLADALAQAGLDVDLAAIIQSQSSDPTSALQMLAGAETVTEVGAADVRGTPTTHYEVVISMAKVVENAPEDLREDFQALADMYTVDTLPMEVWIDGDDRIRRFTQEIDYDKIEFPGDMDLGPLEGTTGEVTAEYYDFGTPVEVTFPDPRDTVSMQQLAELMQPETVTGTEEVGG